MKYSQKELEFIIERIDKQSYELTEWELGFFNSIKPKVENGLTLTDKQNECLNKIWDRLDLK